MVAQNPSDGQEFAFSGVSVRGRGSLNENAHPEVSIYAFPWFSQGDVHGRISFDGIATAKTFVIGY